MAMRLLHYEELSKELTLNQAWKDKEWLERQIDSGLVTAEAIDCLQKQISALEEIYPGNWDIEIDINKYKYFQYINRSDGSRRQTGLNGIEVIEMQFYPIIHFNDITISNTINQSIPLKSIYVKLNGRFDYEHQYAYYVSEISGNRGSASYNEFKKRYLHSHLPSSSSDEYGKTFAKFCLGNGEIGLLFASLSREFDINVFKTLLFHLKGYLEWESLEGSPYISLESLFLLHQNKGLLNLDVNSVASTVKSILVSRKLNNKNLNWKIVDGRLSIIDDEDLEDYCLVTRNYNEFNNCYKDSNREYYPFMRSESLQLPNDLEERYVIFQGQKRILEITGLLTKKFNKIYIHPKIKENVKYRLEYEANKNYSRNNIIRRLQNQSSNATRLHV